MRPIDPNAATPDAAVEAGAGGAFALGQERAQWMSAGFMASMTVPVPTTPWLLERAGCRRTCNAAVALPMAGGIGTTRRAGAWSG